MHFILIDFGTVFSYKQLASLQSSLDGWPENKGGVWEDKAD